MKRLLISVERRREGENREASGRRKEAVDTRTKVVRLLSRKNIDDGMHLGSALIVAQTRSQTDSHRNAVQSTRSAR